MIHVFLGAAVISVWHFGHLLASGTGAEKCICPLMALIESLPLFTISDRSAEKSEIAKADIWAMSGFVKSVAGCSIPPIISWDVKAPSLRSFRKEIISSSTLL